MTKGPHSVRSVNNGCQQRVWGEMFIHPDQPAALVILRPVRQEIRFHFRISVISPGDHRISLFQHSGNRIRHTCGVGTVDGLKPGIAVNIRRDVHKAARTDQCRVDGAVRHNVPVVHGEDLVQLEIVVLEAPEREPVSQRVHRLAAPAQDLGHPHELRRNQSPQILDTVLHVVVPVAHQHPGSLLFQSALQVRPAFICFQRLTAFQNCIKNHIPSGMNTNKCP